MLNWIDWLGTIIDSKILSNNQIIFGSIGLTMKRIINIGKSMIEEDIKKHGKEYWHSLLIVAETLKIELTNV